MTNEAPRKVDPRTVKAWLDSDQALLIDIREPDEYAREHIPGSRLVPLSAFDAADFPKDHAKIGVFHCSSGSRTREAAPRILATGFREVCHLEGGLQAWKKAGFAVTLSRGAPIAIMRQVQITAGALVLAGVLLTLLVSPWFMALSAFVGAGLMFAGISGTCAMANLLAFMPWNRMASAGSPARILSA